MKQGPKYIKIVLDNKDRGKQKKCEICNQTFGLMIKEHQCKRCHRAVCEKCASHKAITLIDGVPSKKPHRQCNVCKDESDSLKKFITQYKVVFLEDSHSYEWLKAFNYTKDKADLEFEQAQRQDKSKEEFNKMKAELQAVFQEIIHYKNYSIAEFFYLVIKDFNTTLIKDSLIRVLGTFLQMYPEVGYAPDQVFLTLFLLCFCSESSAYTLLVLFYSVIVPSYIYPVYTKRYQYEYLSEIEKIMQVLTQAFKMSTQDAPQMKTFLRYRLQRYIQSFTLNFFLLETTFFIINQIFLQPKTGFDDFLKYLAAGFNPFLMKIRQQQYEEIESVLLKNIRSSIVQDGYFSTKQIDFSKIITPLQRKSIVSSLSTSSFSETDQKIDIQSLYSEIARQKNIIKEQKELIDKQQKEIEQLEIKLSQQTGPKQVNQSLKNIDQFMSQQDEELQSLRRVTHQKIANNEIEVQQMSNYIKKLEQQIFIEYKMNVELKDQIAFYQQSKPASNEQSYEIELLRKNVEKYKRKYDKWKQLKKQQIADDLHQVKNLESKITQKEKMISELEIQLNKNKFDNAAKILDLETTNHQLSQKCRELGKVIQGFESSEPRKSDDSQLVQSLKKKIYETQTDYIQQLKDQQEKFVNQINQLNQELRKLREEKTTLSIQTNQKSTNSKVNNGESQELSFNDTKLKLQKLENDYKSLKDRHNQHLQMMIQIETNKKPDPEWQLSLINSKELEIQALQNKILKKKSKIKGYKQQEKAWKKVQVSDGGPQDYGQLISRIVILLNLDNLISPNELNDKSIILLIEKINKLIEIQNNYCEDLSNIFEDGLFVTKLSNLAEEVEESVVFDYNSFISLVEKMKGVLQRINSTKQKIIQIFKLTFGQNDINSNQNIDVIVLNLQSKLQKQQVEKEQLQSQLEQMKLSANKYVDAVQESKVEKKVLQQVRDIIVDLPILSQAEVFTFSEQQFNKKQIDQEDAKYVLEVKKQQIISLKMILVEKQNQLSQFNNSFIQLRDLMSNYFVQIMK